MMPRSCDFDEKTGQMSTEIGIEYLEHYTKCVDPTNTLPLAYAYEGDAGFDLRAAIEKPITVKPFNSVIIPTGVILSPRPGVELQIRSRSGLAFKNGLFVLNSPGTIDSGYRGEIKVCLTMLFPPKVDDNGQPYNDAKTEFVIEPGMKIAQAVAAMVLKVANIPTEEQVRNDKGFGSSGTK